MARQKRSGVSFLWDTMLITDLSKEVPELDLPVYFFHGIYDYTASYTEAKSYFEQLKAPLKDFIRLSSQLTAPSLKSRKKRKCSCCRTSWQEQPALLMENNR